MFKRLDKILVEKFNISRNYSEFLIKNKRIYVNNFLIEKKHQKIKMTDYIEIKKNILPKIEYIYYNENFIIVNKPRNLSCHRSITAHKDEFVLNEIVAQNYTLSNSKIKEQFGLPHRIDKLTEGLILLTRNDETYEYICEKFKKQEIFKTYLCIVKFSFDIPTKNVLSLKILYNFDKVKIDNSGVESITHYEIIKKYDKYGVIKVNPITGKKHQIRVVMNYLGCPIIGDPLYGGAKYDYLCLFSSEIKFDDYFFSLYKNHLHEINNILMKLTFK